MADIKDGNLNQEALQTVLAGILTDITAIAAKLDADAGVTDTDYEATITTTNA